MTCKDCQAEFTISCPQDQIDAATCPSCASANLKLRYMSFPTDGPGFQEGYNPEGLIYGGGAGGGNETDIAGLPLQKIKIKRKKKPEGE